MPLILVTNDDGIHARGIEVLTDIARQFGKTVVIAPAEGQSGMSHAITVKFPLRIKKISDEKDLTIYSCSGTPVDGVKLALAQLLDREPDLIISGINHGSNSSSSVVYSGTMGAAIEGCINSIPAIGFSLLDHSSTADFEASRPYVKRIIEMVLENGLPQGVCLNVNIPAIPKQEIKGMKVCRQNRGIWREEFDKRMDPRSQEYYWLTGEFYDLEPESADTDQWALLNNYVSVVPVQPDMTAYKFMDTLKSWDFSDNV